MVDDTGVIAQAGGELNPIDTRWIPGLAGPSCRAAMDYREKSFYNVRINASMPMESEKI